MKTLRTGAIWLSATLATFALHAQTAEEIVSKHIAALGGKDVVGSVKSIYIESTIDVNSMQVPSTTYILNAKGYKSEVTFNGTKIIQCFTDKGGWTVNPMVGATTPTALPADQVKASQGQLQVGGPLFDYAAKGSKVELIGTDTAGGKSYKIQLTSKDGPVIVFYIDASTYFIKKAVAKVTAQGQTVEITSVFSDYRKTDSGFYMPYAQQQILPQMTLGITHTKIEINKAMDPAIFDMPK
jgi:hypothetical protein